MVDKWKVMTVIMLVLIIGVSSYVYLSWKCQKSYDNGIDHGMIIITEQTTKGNIPYFALNENKNMTVKWDRIEDICGR